jgi:hypothetical protein
VSTKADVRAAMYLHCRQCVEESVPPAIEAFVDQAGKVWVWCRHHDREVFHTKVAVMDVSKLACGACGSGVPHVH